MTLTPDLVEDTVVEETPQGIKIRRRYDVANVDSPTRSGYMLRALEAGGLPRIGDRHPQRGAATLRSRRVLPTADGCGCKIELDYDSFIGDVTLGQQNTLIVEEDTSLAQEVLEAGTFYSKGAGLQPVATIKKFTINRQGSTSGPPVVGRINVHQPLRSLRIVSIQRKRPADLVFDLPGFVNLGRWLGKPQGFWLCLSVARAREFEQGTGRDQWWAVRGQFLTRIRRNWTEVDFMRDTSGRVLNDIDVASPVDQTISGYEHNVTHFDGAIAVGPYPCWPFKDAFGFDYEEIFGKKS